MRTKLGCCSEIELLMPSTMPSSVEWHTSHDRVYLEEKKMVTQQCRQQIYCVRLEIYAKALMGSMLHILLVQA